MTAVPLVVYCSVYEDNKQCEIMKNNINVNHDKPNRASTRQVHFFAEFCYIFCYYSLVAILF